MDDYAKIIKITALDLIRQTDDADLLDLICQILLAAQEKPSE